jgi:hypothetical protein
VADRREKSQNVADRPIMTDRRTFSLADAHDFLAWLQEEGPRSLDDLAGTDIFPLVGLGTLGRVESTAPLAIEIGDGPVSAFARAVGLPQVLGGAPRLSAREPERSVTLGRFLRQQAHDLDTIGRDIARLITREPDAADAVEYILVELLRNVIQHSDDPLGGVVAAQVIERPGVSRRVQVVVGDAGVGVFEALTRRRLHPGLADVRTALEKALHPHFSGTFREGETGTWENAGLGLYVLSELAKATGGSFLLASRGDALLLRDMPLAKDRAVFLDQDGFPGTLVVFECVLETLTDFRSLLTRITAKAGQQKPGRVTEGVLRFVDEAPAGVRRFLVAVASEDTTHAVDFAKSQLVPIITAGEAIALDFQNWTSISQSYLHALLYVVIRMAWATKGPIYVLHASSVVQSAIEWIESYALVG